MPGFVVTVLSLTLLQAVVSSNQGSGRVAGVLTGAQKLVERLADPTVPGIPDLRTSADGATSSSTTSPSTLVTPAAPTTPTTGATPRLPVVV